MYEREVLSCEVIEILKARSFLYEMRMPSVKWARHIAADSHYVSGELQHSMGSIAFLDNGFLVTLPGFFGAVRGDLTLAAGIGNRTIGNMRTRNQE